MQVRSTGMPPMPLNFTTGMLAVFTNTISWAHGAVTVSSFTMSANLPTIAARSTANHLQDYQNLVPFKIGTIRVY